MIDIQKGYIVLFVLVFSILCSCGDDMTDNSNTDNQSSFLNSKINVKVSVCEDLFCTQSRSLSNIEVNLKRDDAEPFYKTGTTDELGEFSLMLMALI